MNRRPLPSHLHRKLPVAVVAAMALVGVTSPAYASVATDRVEQTRYAQETVGLPFDQSTRS